MDNQIPFVMILLLSQPLAWLAWSASCPACSCQLIFSNVPAWVTWYRGNRLLWFCGQACPRPSLAWLAWATLCPASTETETAATKNKQTSRRLNTIFTQNRLFWSCSSASPTEPPSAQLVCSWHLIFSNVPAWVAWYCGNRSLWFCGLACPRHSLAWLAWATLRPTSPAARTALRQNLLPRGISRPLGA
jgi:hypothetical protein